MKIDKDTLRMQQIVWALYGGGTLVDWFFDISKTMDDYEFVKACYDLLIEYHEEISS